jgi:hypothetical protein
MKNHYEIDPKEKEYDRVVKFFVYLIASVSIFLVLLFLAMMSLYFFL